MTLHQLYLQRARERAQPHPRETGDRMLTERRRHPHRGMTGLLAALVISACLWALIGVLA